MQTGGVTGLAMAFDDTAVISAAQDGSILVVNYPLAQGPAALPQFTMEHLPTMAAAGVPSVEDLGQGAPSFEDDKQAAVADAIAAQAAKARQGLLGEFDTLREELQALLAVNSTRPAGHQLPRSAFSIDPGEASCSW